MYNESIQKKIQTRDGTKIYYRYHDAANSKPTLVFIHGLSGNHTVWKFSIEYFMRRGYSILAYDLRGHGNSSTDGDINKFMIKNMTIDLNQIIKKEKVRTER